MGDLSEFFSLYEFACPCDRDCGVGTQQKEIDTKLLELLDKARAQLKRPIIISSGARCIDHNRDEGGKEKSSHIALTSSDGLKTIAVCRAVDIVVPNSLHRFHLVSALLFAGFNRIGIGKTFVHADTNPNLPFRMWVYS